MLNRKISKLKKRKKYLFFQEKNLRLDKNERVNKFPKNLIKSLNLTSFDLSAYPETGKIYKLLSKKICVDINQLLIIPGSEFGIRICLEYFCNKKNSQVIALEPTFGMVDAYTKKYNIKKIKILYNNLLEIDHKDFINKIKRNISLIIIANPNSPTGSIIKKNMLLDIISKANKFKIPVIIDEAYNGFYSFSYLRYLKKYNNLLILRTFSKSFGLAGLRAG